MFPSHDPSCPPEFWAARTIEQMTAVSEDAPPHVLQQVEAFRQQLYEVVLRNIRNAIYSDRTTLAYLLNSQGHADLAKILKELCMAISNAVCNSFKQELLVGTHNFTASSGNTFKLALYTSSATLGASTTAFTTSPDYLDYPDCLELQ